MVRVSAFAWETGPSRTNLNQRIRERAEPWHRFVERPLGRMLRVGLVIVLAVGAAVVLAADGASRFITRSAGRSNAVSVEHVRRHRQRRHFRES